MARAAAARGTAMGLSSFASKPLAEVVAANPRTFFQIYWAGGRDADGPAAGPGPGGRGGRPDPHPGLVVLAPAATGAARGIPERHDLRELARQAPEGLRRPRWLARLRPDRAAARPAPCRTWPGPANPPPRSSAPTAVDADSATQLGRRGLARRGVGRPGHAQGHRPARRRPPGRRRRGDRHLGVQPRRQQPRRHPGHHPRPAGRRRRRRPASRSCSTAASAAAATSSRRSPWAPARS